MMTSEEALEFVALQALGFDAGEPRGSPGRRVRAKS